MPHAARALGRSSATPGTPIRRPVTVSGGPDRRAARHDRQPVAYRSLAAAAAWRLRHVHRPSWSRGRALGRVCCAGPAAALSHRTAAELHKLADEPSRLVHVTVPAWQRVEPISGVIIHHSRAFGTIVHPTASPPRTRVEHTVLDLSESCASFDDAFTWLCRAVGRGLTTPELLRAAMAERSRLRWRADLVNALADISAGVLSLLERRYVCDVEQPHGLPAARSGKPRPSSEAGAATSTIFTRKRCLPSSSTDRRRTRRSSDGPTATGITRTPLSGCRRSATPGPMSTERPCAVAAEVGALLNYARPGRSVAPMRT